MDSSRRHVIKNQDTEYAEETQRSKREKGQWKKVEEESRDSTVDVESMSSDSRAIGVGY